MEAHGGLTFAGPCMEGAEEGPFVCHVPEPGRPDEVWWLGFDCGHAFDLSPTMAAKLRELDPGLRGPMDEYETYRTLGLRPVRGNPARRADPREGNHVMREPSAEECSARARVQLDDTRSGWACWYPSMGGYAGRAVVVVPGQTGHADVFVWHNGEFPFPGQNPPYGEPSNPMELHHCDGVSFVAFGNFLEELIDEHDNTGES